MLKLPNQPEKAIFYHQTKMTMDGLKWENILGDNQSFSMLHPNDSYQKISEQFSQIQSMLSIFFDTMVLEVVFIQYFYSEEELQNASNPLNSRIQAAIKTELFLHRSEIPVPAKEVLSFINKADIHGQYLEQILDTMITQIKQDPAWQLFQKREELNNKLTDELLDNIPDNHSSYNDNSSSGKFKI
jgi:hypothetical protein